MERPLNADLVENPFDIESDVGLKGLRVRQQWDDKIVKYIEQENIQALYLYTDWRGTDYSFLKHLPGIKKLHILSGRESHNISAIEGMIGLENLNVKWITKEKVDFSRLTRLRDCVLTWWPGARSIFQAKSLVQLSLDEFRTSDYEELGQLDGLRKLKISNSGIQDIRFLPALGKLERLELINCKKVSDFAPISRLPHLKWLSIDGASQMGSVDFLAGLKRIEYFNFSRCNEIGTIKPLGQLKTLKAVFFLGDTNIKDGDLAPLAKLPVLAILGFNDRKHYSHRLIKPYNWSDWDKPDKLLEEK